MLAQRRKRAKTLHPMATAPRRLFCGEDSPSKENVEGEEEEEEAVAPSSSLAKLLKTVKPNPNIGGSDSEPKRSQRTKPQGGVGSATVAPPVEKMKKKAAVTSSAVAQQWSKYVIKPMAMKDCAACFHLGELVFTSDFPNLYRFWDEYEVIDCYSGDPELCFVAETDNEERRVFAFVLANIIKKSDHTRFGYVHWIAVDPAFRRRRIGTHLYDKVYKIMVEKNVKMILADTPNENDSAKSFFVYHGFGDPIQHVFMSLNLSNSESDRGEEFPTTSTTTVTTTTTTTHTTGKKRARGGGKDPGKASSSPSSSTSASSPASSSTSLASSSSSVTTATVASTTLLAGGFAGKGKKRVGNTPQIVVRAMGIDDMHAVYELGDKVFGDNKKPNMFRFWEPSGVLDLFETDSETCLVAELGNEIVGFCLGTTIVKKRSAWKYGYIIWLGISPVHQGLGIGTRLFQHFQRLMVEENVRMLLIDTQADVPAVKFWEKQRFGHTQDHVFYSKKMEGVSDDFLSSETVRASSSSQPSAANNLPAYEMAPPKEPVLMTDPSVVGLRRKAGSQKRQMSVNNGVVRRSSRSQGSTN